MGSRLRELGSGTLPGERAIDPLLVEHATVELRRIDRVRGLAYARSVGAFLLRVFFSDSGRLCAERARSHCSYRALARRDDLPMSRSTLYRCVQVELQCRELPDELASALSVSHHAVLFCVSDPLRKRMLARRAVSEGLTCRALADAERQGRAPAGEGPRRGRPPLPPLVKGVNRLGRALARVEELSVSPERMATWGPERCRAVRDAVTEHVATLEELRETLEHAMALAAAETVQEVDVQQPSGTLTASP